MKMVALPTSRQEVKDEKEGKAGDMPSLPKNNRVAKSSPLESFSGVILSASIPFLLLKSMRISKPKNTSKIKNKYQVALYKAGKIKAQQKIAIMPISK